MTPKADDIEHEEPPRFNLFIPFGSPEMTGPEMPTTATPSTAAATDAA